MARPIFCLINLCRLAHREIKKYNLSMAKYTITKRKYFKTENSYSIDVDTTDQKQWEELLLSAESLMDEKDFKKLPKQAPNDLKQWEDMVAFMDTADLYCKNNTWSDEQMFADEDEIVSEEIS